MAQQLRRQNTLRDGDHLLNRLESAPSKQLQRHHITGLQLQKHAWVDGV